MEEMGKGRLPYINANLYAMYLHKPLSRLYGMTPKEFVQLKKTNPEALENLKLNIFFDIDKIIITPGNKIQAMRPPGIDIDLWRAFISYLIQEYGYYNLDSVVVTTISDMIREKVNTYLRVFKIDVRVASFDPSKLDKELVNKLPKDIRNFLFSGSYLPSSQRNKALNRDHSAGDNSDDSS